MKDSRRDKAKISGFVMPDAVDKIDNSKKSHNNKSTNDHALASDLDNNSDDISEAANEIDDQMAAQKQELEEIINRNAPSNQKEPAPDSIHTFAKAKADAVRILTIVTTELVVGMGLGGFVGWQIDKYFDSFPGFFLVCLLLGFAAAMYTLIKYMNKHFPIKPNK